jgi:hypothetical protein
LVHRDQADQELDEEVRSYLEQLVMKKISEGMTPEEVQRSSRISFGGVEQVKEEVRDVRAGRILEDFARDVRFAFRTLAKSPGFTTVALLTLALGLAASTAIFSVINGVLLQPLDYPNAGQLVAIELSVPKLVHKFPMIPINPAAYLAWSHQAKSLAGIGVVGEGVTMNLTGGDEPALLSADAVTANLFDVLGVQPQLGRSFLPDADQAGHNYEVILTNGLWQSRFQRSQRRRTYDRP